jgi:putative flippase GtrA
MSGRRVGASGLQGAVRHYGGFLLAGITAYLVDAGVLQALITLGGMSPFTARIWGIGAAMLASWLINRSVTFPVAGPPTLREMASFAALGWVAALLSYLIYAGILLLRPETAPLLALTVAALIGMVYSYLGMRFGVFRQRR